MRDGLTSRDMAPCQPQKSGNFCQSVIIPYVDDLPAVFIWTEFLAHQPDPDTFLMID